MASRGASTPRQTRGFLENRRKVTLEANEPVSSTVEYFGSAFASGSGKQYHAV
jgi:hypothetical protein